MAYQFPPEAQKELDEIDAISQRFDQTLAELKRDRAEASKQAQQRYWEEQAQKQQQKNLQPTIAPVQPVEAPRNAQEAWDNLTAWRAAQGKGK